MSDGQPHCFQDFLKTTDQNFSDTPAQQSLPLVTHENRAQSFTSLLDTEDK